jgi:hypothetical protein
MLQSCRAGALRQWLDEWQQALFAWDDPQTPNSNVTARMSDSPKLAIALSTGM